MAASPPPPNDPLYVEAAKYLLGGGFVLGAYKGTLELVKFVFGKKTDDSAAFRDTLIKRIEKMEDDHKIAIKDLKGECREEIRDLKAEHKEELQKVKDEAEKCHEKYTHAEASIRMILNSFNSMVTYCTVMQSRLEEITGRPYDLMPVEALTMDDFKYDAEREISYEPPSD